MKLRGTWHGANGVPIGVTFRSPRQKTSLTDGWKLLEQGPERQSASLFCWGGVSSVMGSSDFDAHSFVPSGHKVISIKAYCLEGLNDRLLGWRAFQLVSDLGLVVYAP